MTTASTKEIIRWILVLPAAFLGFATSVVIALSLEGLVSNVFPMLKSNASCFEGFDGAFAATLFVFSGTFVAPRNKIVVSLCLLVAGAICANYCVFPLFVILDSDGGTFHFWSPLIGTYLGGLGACAWIYATKPRVSSTTSPSPA